MTESEGKKPEKSALKQIRTFQGDVAEALRSQKESLFSIQQAEAAKKAKSAKPAKKAPTAEEKQARKTLAMIVGSFVLVALGIAGGWYAYITIDAKRDIPFIPPPETRLVSATRTVEISTVGMERTHLISAIAQLAGAGLPDTEALHIDIRKEVTDAEGVVSDAAVALPEFLEILETDAPSRLVRAFQPVFMLGVLGGESEGSVFIIARLASFENAFAGMLDWEESLARDLGAIFSTREFFADETLLSKEFEDITTRNKDARVLRTSGRRTVLLYSFFDQNTLVITDSEESLRALISRLETALLSR